jgi:tetratricopeptide (TPR) repeat protein
MNKTLKTSLIYPGVAIALIIVFFLFKMILLIPARKNIPSLPDMQSLSTPLKEQLTRTSENAYHHPNSENLGLLGMVYNSGTFYEKAELCYKAASEMGRSEWVWNYYLGNLMQEMGDPRAAIKNYREVNKKNPGVFLAWYYVGECFQKIGLSDSAEISFKVIINRMDRNVSLKTPDRYDYFPLVTYAMYDLARIYLNTGRVDLAEKTLSEIIINQRAFGPAYRLMGNVYTLKGNEELGKRYQVRANDLAENPFPVDTLVDKLSLISRSDMYLLKRIDEAEKNVYPEFALKLVDHSLVYFPENNYLVSKAIKLYLIRGMGKKALPYINQHINYFRQDFNELKSVGDLLYSSGFYNQALNYYTYAISLKPSDSQVQSCLVICLSKVGEKEKALETVYAVLDKNKSNASVIADCITLLLNLGEKEKAVMWLSQLKKISPQSVKGFQLTGTLQEQDQKWNEAIMSYNSAFKIDPSDMITARLLGNLLVRQKLWEKAIKHFGIALEYNPNEPYLLERLGTLLVTCSDPGLRDMEKGKELCERAFIHTASHSATLISAGRSLSIAYALTGDKRNATNVLRMTINLARGENVSSDYMNDLQNLLMQFAKSK